MTEGLASHHTRIVDEELHGEVVRAIHHEVIFPDEVKRVVSHQELAVRVHLHVGIDGVDGHLGGFHLPFVHIRRGVDNLTLQIAQIDHISIHDADGADTCRCQIHRHWSTQATSANHEHLALSYLLLTLHANVLQENVTRVAVQLFFCEIKHIRFLLNPTSLLSHIIHS